MTNYPGCAELGTNVTCSGACTLANTARAIRTPWWKVLASYCHLHCKITEAGLALPGNDFLWHFSWLVTNCSRRKNTSVPGTTESIWDEISYRSKICNDLKPIARFRRRLPFTPIFFPRIGVWPFVARYPNFLAAQTLTVPCEMAVLKRLVWTDSYLWLG